MYILSELINYFWVCCMQFMNFGLVYTTEVMRDIFHQVTQDIFNNNEASTSKELMPGWGRKQVKEEAEKCSYFYFSLWLIFFLILFSLIVLNFCQFFFGHLFLYYTSWYVRVCHCLLTDWIYTRLGFSLLSVQPYMGASLYPRVSLDQLFSTPSDTLHSGSTCVHRVD